jgi:hypothetical protein
MGSEDQEGGDPDQEEEEQQAVQAGPGPGTIAAARHRVQAEGDQIRSRSPTPPRALFRSTTGKGVAFTDEDVAFLVRFMQYRKYVCVRCLMTIILILFFPLFFTQISRKS